MKHLLVVAVLGLSAGSAFAETGGKPTPPTANASGPQVPTPDLPERPGLLAEMDSWRAVQLPVVTPPDPLTLRFAPRLDEIKWKVDDAKTPAQLTKAKDEFEHWKVVLLRAKYRRNQSQGMDGQSFADFSADQVRLAHFSATLSQQVHLEQARRNLVPLVALTGPAIDFGRVFDQSATRAGSVPTTSIPTMGSFSDGAVAAAPTYAPGDPARYAKVRSILISQGARPKIVDMAIAEAIRQNADPILVLSVIKQESGFNAHITSPVGARGLMQIMPDTGRGLGVRNANMLYDAQTNLRAGIRFLKSLWGQFVGGDMTSLQAMNPWSSHQVKSAVAAYNAGAGAVQKYNGVPPYRETQGYVKSVLANYANLKQYLGW